MGRHYPNGGPLKRHLSHQPTGKARALADDHAAVVEGRTLFPSRVFHASMLDRLLKSGANSRKTGARVTKGRWAGMPIFTLTLEERATCPRSCQQWANCYGSGMQYAQRIIADAPMRVRLRAEVEALAVKHPGGFVVRLHILGDFPDVDYVGHWAAMLAEVPALRVFGYTAHDPETPIGAAIMALSFEHYDRCRIRFSGTDADGLGALVIEDAAQSQHVICPAQLGRTDCCGTCGLCWTMNRVVEFLKH